MIVVVTILFVILYKYRCLKLIFAWLIGSTGMLLGLFGALFFYFLLDSYNIPFDWISFSFLIWNFMVGGLIAIFWYAPTKITQGYLIIISTFMAVFFTKFPEWTTWAILAAVAIYDVFAVLCPRGPLKILVDLAQERQEPIPALLYSSCVFMMTNEDDSISSPDQIPLLDSTKSTTPIIETATTTTTTTATTATTVTATERPKPRKSVKLGLGDFIFYSVLVGRAALYDMITVFTCFIAIITGLFFTLLLLALFNKALPALPISIMLGLIFFFATKVFLLPFIVTIGSVSIFV